MVGRARLVRWLQSPLAVAAVSVALCLPALGAGLFTDDHVLLGEIEGRFPPPHPWELYSFCPDGERLEELLAAGAYPWWTSPEARIRLFRPLPSLLIHAEHAVFGREPLGYHLVTLAAFAAMLLAASRVLRAALPGLLGGVAFAVFAWNDLQAQPASWLSNRHATLAACLGFAGVFLHVRRRERGDSWGGASALGLSGLGLLCSEVGLQPLAYVLAYELSRRRIRPVLPAAALAVGYLVAYQAFGFGTRGSAAYLDPFEDPAAFLLALARRLPAFAADLFAGVPLDLWLFAPGAQFALVATGVAALALLGWGLWRTWPALEEAEARGLRWLLAGAALAAIPATAGVPGSRLLLVPGLGAAAAVAALVVRLRGRPLATAAAVCLGALHLVWQPILLLGQSRAIERIGHRSDAVARESELVAREGTDVALLGVSDPHLGLYVGLQRLLSDRRPRSWHSLTMAACEHRLERVAEDTLDVRLVGCRMMENDWERLFSPARRRFEDGEVVKVPGLRVEIVETAGGAPVRLRFQFDRSLDDPDLALLAWRDGALRRLRFPPEGQGQVVVPPLEGQP